MSSLTCLTDAPLFIASSNLLVCSLVNAVVDVVVGGVCVLSPSPASHKAKSSKAFFVEPSKLALLAALPKALLLTSPNVLAHTNPNHALVGTGINGIDHIVLVNHFFHESTPMASHRSLEKDSAAINIIQTTPIPNKLISIHPI